MQRILSVETSRSGALASEFVSKRLCCSFILTVAFLALLGGFLMGKFVSDKSTMHLRASYQDISRKIISIRSNMKNTFQNQCNFTSAVNGTEELPVPVFLDHLNKCLSNG